MLSGPVYRRVYGVTGTLSGFIFMICLAVSSEKAADADVAKDAPFLTVLTFTG